MNTVSQLLPDYSKYLQNYSDPVKKMGSKKKGKVLVRFLKEAIQQDWKNNGEVHGIINRSIEVLKKKKDKDKLAKGAKRKFKVLKKTFKEELEAYQSALQAQAEVILPTPENAQKIEAKIVEEITKCPATHKLYQEACAVQKACFDKGLNRSPNLRIQVVSETNSGFEAEAAYYIGVVRVKLSHCMMRMVSLAVFELCNVKRQEQFDDIWQRAKKGVITSADEFAHINECIEHGSAMEHHRVIEESGWDTSCDFYKYTTTDAEADWQSRKNSHHANYWRRAYQPPAIGRAVAANVA